ncbi:MAG: hypothetical protein J6Q84_06560 [Kiritimatiellae bacterium]|nr:hypothetical protein [Kiritimatiellia bacterium]
MMKKSIVVVLSALCATQLLAKIEMGAPFSDYAVLQRNMKLPVWGKATVGNEITVDFAGQKSSTKVNAEGKWRVDLSPLEASAEGRKMTIQELASDGGVVDTFEVKDVLVGEVWFASGQSNMECPIWEPNPRYRDANGGMMINATFLNNVRYASIKHKWSTEPEFQKTQWRRFIPSDLKSGRHFSAVGFYYAREIYLALGGVPVGIVSANWGGTNIDAWTPRSGYENSDPSIKATAEYPVKKNWTPKDAKGPIGRAHQQPTVLWNGMVSAWAPFANRGFIWYQGCHNAKEANLYCAKMHALYNGWSKEFENPNLKLYFVQLAPYKTNWMKLVAAQNKFAAEEKNAAIAVTADVGNFSDIHPNNKEIVAKRLALHALKNDYGFDISEVNSPVFKSVKFEGAKAIATFENVSFWYVYADNRSTQPAFELAGKDGKWYPAKLLNVNELGQVKGVDLELKSDKVAEPVKIRYMGRNNTMGTIYNQVSLPLCPFESSCP